LAQSADPLFISVAIYGAICGPCTTALEEGPDQRTIGVPTSTRSGSRAAHAQGPAQHTIGVPTRARSGSRPGHDRGPDQYCLCWHKRPPYAGIRGHLMLA
jgi:hypothetical protein